MAIPTAGHSKRRAGSATLGVVGNVLAGGSRQFDRVAAAQRAGQVGVSIAAGLECLELLPGR
jgi:hypothetical protein